MRCRGTLCQNGAAELGVFYSTGSVLHCPRHLKPTTVKLHMSSKGSGVPSGVSMLRSGVIPQCISKMSRSGEMDPRRGAFDRKVSAPDVPQTPSMHVAIEGGMTVSVIDTPSAAIAYVPRYASVDQDPPAVETTRLFKLAVNDPSGLNVYTPSYIVQVGASTVVVGAIGVSVVVSKPVGEKIHWPDPVT